MKLAVSLLALSGLITARHVDRPNNNEKHKQYLQRRDHVLHGRQAVVSGSQPAATGGPVASHSAGASHSVVLSGAIPTGTGSIIPIAGSASMPVVTTPTVAGSIIPPLNQITMNAPIATPLTMFTTFSPGASAPYTGAPALPTFILGPHPELDVIPPVDSPEVKQWLSEIDLSKVPKLQQTVDGSCASDPALATDTSRCWWTCGGCTRDTDIVTCPTKQDWGVSYDDGPSPYTPKLVNYLHTKNITATFYVVGSRVVSRPEMLQTEYMLGHEISIHTWSHHPLTTLTNEQIVAELGWTRKFIKDVIGVSPRFMRPPYGDIDDRVRAICAAMDLIPVIWTGKDTGSFDTDDWKIAGGTATGPSSFAAWQKIVSTASSLTTGFIALQHDLYQQSVDMAVGYITPDALAHVPKFNLKSIIECQLKDRSESYAELTTAGNKSGARAVTQLGSSTLAVVAGLGAVVAGVLVGGW